MDERYRKGAMIGAAVLAPVFMVLFAYKRPGYFTSQTYLGGLLFLEFLFVAVLMFRRVFFPVLVLSFLFSGVNLPVGSFWSGLRWLLLGVGALVGAIMVARDKRHHFSAFHIMALFVVLGALMSAAVSRYPSFALLKVLSLFLLFAYCATGVRLAVVGREGRFFTGLLTGCEILVGMLVLFHLLGVEAMGNPNSLGAITGVVAAPILLWGALLQEERGTQIRRTILYVLCMYLVLHSHARAGVAAAIVSSTLLCVGLRRYRLFVQGAAALLVVVAATAIIQPEVISQTIFSVTTEIVYKSTDPTHGFLKSRVAPWEMAINRIRDNFWFGTGFGTADNGQDASNQLAQFSTVAAVNVENGSSYLSILTWVGVLGAAPFFCMVVMVLVKAMRAMRWLFKTGNPYSPAIPLAALTIGGLLHAGFEDWLFAPGYYICVAFWSAAFILADFVPQRAAQSVTRLWRPEPMPQGLGRVATTR